MKLKKFIDNVKETKNKETNKIIDETTSSYITGATIGGVSGAILGFVRKKNILLSIFLGSMFGAIISNAITKKIKTGN